MTSEKPRMALTGVRNSWLIVARKRDLARFAASARRRARSLFALACSSSAISSSFSAWNVSASLILRFNCLQFPSMRFQSIAGLPSVKSRHNSCALRYTAVNVVGAEGFHYRLDRFLLPASRVNGLLPSIQRACSRLRHFWQALSGTPGAGHSALPWQELVVTFGFITAG